GVPIPGARVVDQRCLPRIDRGDRIDGVEEDRSRVADQFRQPLDLNALNRFSRGDFLVVGPLVDRLDAGDKPLFVADLDDGAGGEGFSLTELESLRRHQLTSWEVVHYIRHLIPPWLERPTPVHFHPGPLLSASLVHLSALVTIPT